MVESVWPSSSRISAATWGRMTDPPLATADADQGHLQRRGRDLALADARERERAACCRSNVPGTGPVLDRRAGIEVERRRCVDAEARPCRGGNCSPMSQAELRERRVARVDEALLERSSAALAAEVLDRPAGLRREQRRRRVGNVDVGRRGAGVERGLGRHDLERRPGWVALAVRTRQQPGRRAVRVEQRPSTPARPSGRGPRAAGGRSSGSSTSR